jgi:NAD+ kinase
MTPFLHKAFYIAGRYAEQLEPKLEAIGLAIADDPEDADIIVCYGGDGTLLSQVQEYRRLFWPIRDEQTAQLCPKHQLDKQLDMFIHDKLRITVLPTLIGRAKVGPLSDGGSTSEYLLWGMNDVFLHSANHATALRYTVEIDDELYAREVVSDAVGVATRHGATAYYRNITHSIFRVGMGLAFSNSTETVDHIVLDDRSVVTIRILRGPAVMTADNVTAETFINEGDSVKISMSDEYIKTLGLDVFMCPECRRLRHQLRDSTRFLGGAK